MLRGAAPAPSRAEILRPLFSLATTYIALGCLAIMWASPESYYDGPTVFYPFGAGPTGDGLGISTWALGVVWLVTFAVFGASWLSQPRPRWALPVLVFAELVFIFGLWALIEAFVPPGAYCCPVHP